VLLEAVSTVDWSARCRHKRYFRFCTAVGAFDFRHLPGGTITSILVTHLVFHRPYSLVIRKIILTAIIGTGLTALPSSTQVRSPVYRLHKRQDHYKRWLNTCDCAQAEMTIHIERVLRRLCQFSLSVSIRKMERRRVKFSRETRTCLPEIKHSRYTLLLSG
jgi:hypothetical protein